MIKKTIGIVLFLVIFVNFFHGRYNKPTGVIQWDIKSYYAYLPAAFIYNDLSLKFMGENMAKFGDLIWPIDTPTGNKAIVTSMGMAVLYTPFFLIAHAFALLSPHEADGYSLPYRFALTFSAFFFLWLGLVFLAKILIRFFSEKIVAFTIIAIALGTNLFFYSTYEAPLPHAYNFALITLFIWLIIRFYEKPSIKMILWSGLLAGFIALIRPTNIIILLFFFLWDIKSWADFRERFLFFLQRYYWVLLMAGAFVLAWVPQFIYWYYIAGKIFYYSYGEIGGSFFFNNPQIFNILLSYKKGWLVYTPLMMFAIVGIFFLPRKIPGLFPSIVIFTLVNIYVLSSWWCWWYGGSFGQRVFVDSYGLLAIPFACFVDFTIKQKRWIRSAVFTLLILLVAFNQFQTRQYVNAAIHWWWMNKEAYWETFLKLRPTEKYWKAINLPDYVAARQGKYIELKSMQQIEDEKKAAYFEKSNYSEEQVKEWISKFVFIDSISFERLRLQLTPKSDTQEVAHKLANQMYIENGYEFWHRKMAVELIVNELLEDPKIVKDIEKKALENNKSFEIQLHEVANWLYDKRKN
jgi:hypothetical protein